MIDWNELARVDLKACCEFRSEKFAHNVREMYRDIVLDPERDNDEIKSLWLNICNNSPPMKRDFLMYVMQTRERGESRPIDYLDVLRYFNLMSHKELQQAEEIKLHSSKYN